MTCDADCQFTSISILCPGGTGDSRAFAASYLHQVWINLIHQKMHLTSTCLSASHQMLSNGSKTVLCFKHCTSLRTFFGMRSTIYVQGLLKQRITVERKNVSCWKKSRNQKRLYQHWLHNERLQKKRLHLRGRHFRRQKTTKSNQKCKRKRRKAIKGSYTKFAGKHEISSAAYHSGDLNGVCCQIDTHAAGKGDISCSGKLLTKL